MKILELIGYLFTTLVISFLLIVPLQVYIVRDTLFLYNIPGVEYFTKEVVYGIIFINQLIFFKKPKEDKTGKSVSEKMKQSLEDYFIYVIVLLSVWGLIHIFHHLKF